MSRWIDYPGKSLVSPEQFQLESDWINQLSGGPFAINHLNRLMVFASEKNVTLTSPDWNLIITNKSISLHSILSQLSSNMTNAVAAMNDTNNWIIINMTRLFSHLDRLKRPPTNTKTFDELLQSPEDIRKTFDMIALQSAVGQSLAFKNFCSMIIEIIAPMYWNQTTDITYTSSKLFQANQSLEKRITEKNDATHTRERTEDDFKRTHQLYMDKQNEYQDVNQIKKRLKNANAQQSAVVAAYKLAFDEWSDVFDQLFEKQTDVNITLKVLKELFKLHYSWSLFNEFFVTLEKQIRDIDNVSIHFSRKMIYEIKRLL